MDEITILGSITIMAVQIAQEHDSAFSIEMRMHACDGTSCQERDRDGDDRSFHLNSERAHARTHTQAVSQCKIL